MGQFNRLNYNLAIIMTYLAPRQGIFAAIVLASLTLHLLFFVISAERGINAQNQQVVNHSVAALSQELVAPLAAYDRVSMSVIAEPYTNEQAVGYIGIYDSQGRILVPLGEASDGYRTEQIIATGDQVLGKVAVQAKPISRAQILSDNWVFLLSVIGLHIILWLVYGYVARPTAELKRQIAQRVRTDLLNKGLLSEQQPAKVEAAEPEQSPSQASDDEQDDELQIDDSSDEATLSAAYTVQLSYDDPRHLLATVSIDTKAAYLALCDQLFDKACQALLELPLFAGVETANKKTFDDSGVSITLHAKEPTAKTATAAALLSKLLVMVNEVVYQKHREIRRFALPVKAVCSDADSAEIAKLISLNRKEQLLIILPEAGRNQVSTYMSLSALKQPRSTHERDAREIVSVTNATTERLKIACDKVLLFEDNA
ncbi:Uncharacterised protein [Moraxella cuniculi]|uniref:Uncharacterized protein n=2 Tax=Moraxella cuniculi TaxID=34061 RepID=A0A3S4SYY8_9GAMM|nr:Uncharacterised protein [Moraxella cuniculi]